MARARLTIDLQAVAANWQALEKASGHAECGAVVKADAYGLGLAEVARTLKAAGARAFFVALAEEGRALRDVIGGEPDIYVFSGFMDGDADALTEARLIPLLNSPEQVKRWRSEMPSHPIGIQLDTGMNRLGIEPAELPGIALGLPALTPRLVMSHLASSDTPSALQNTAQLTAFLTLAAGFPMARKSLAATGGIHIGASYHFDITRPGIGLYGGHPGQTSPVVALHAPIIQIRDVLPGESVGYGAAWTAKRLSKIATISIGYADGFFRGTSGAHVYADGTPCPVVGRISMDLVTVDVTDAPNPPQTLEILGPHQGIDDLAAASGTIGYEVLTSLGARFARRYIS